MSFLSRAKKPTAKPPIITIIGSPGVGKTTLGATFPNPIFIQAEDGSSVFTGWPDEDLPTLLPALPKGATTTNKNTGVTTYGTRDILTAQMRELATADHDFQTLVIDSVTSLQTLFEEEIAERDQVKTVADASGGFHKGYIEVASWHADLIYQATVLRDRKNMAVVFLAHSGIEKIKLDPEQATEYAVFSLDMHKKSAALYVAQSDAVLYLTKSTAIIGAEKDKRGRQIKAGVAMQTGDRTLVTTGDGRTGYLNAKSRYPMPAEIAVGQRENPILEHIPFFVQ